MTANPGFIPKASSRGQTKQAIDELIESNNFDEQHFCTACLIRKPLRSKHCKRCGRCIAREDHHCPWVDNCVGVNNHKHFVLYLICLIIGLILLIQLTLRYIAILSVPDEYHCTILQDELCAQWSKDPLTLVTTIWGSLQLIWTVMLLAAHFAQIARALTTYESMRSNHDIGPITTAVVTGTTSLEAANVLPDGAEHSHPHGHSHPHKKKKGGYFSSWIRLLGLDTFFTIAFNGYHGSKNMAHDHRAHKRPNPFYRGILRNCEDFWLDGPVFGQKENGAGLVGGQSVNYTSMYEVPRGGMRMSGYEAVSTIEEGEG